MAFQGLNKLYLTLALFCFATGVFFLIYPLLSNERSFIVSNSANKTQVGPIAGPAPKTQEAAITFLAVGDIMLDRGVEYMINRHGQSDFSFPFQKIKPYFETADLIFGNLESVVSDRGYNVGSAYSFRANPLAIDGLRFAGFDVLNLAHNHALDYTAAALEETMDLLKKARIEYVGAGWGANEAFALKTIEVQRTRFGFLGYTNLGSSSWQAKQDGSTGIAWINRENFPFLRENIEMSKSQVDILIVSLHSGQEYQAEPDLFQKDFAKLVIDSGADLVLGHHPHVIQPLEQYKQGWVAYSLGNFVFDQAFSTETMQGGLLKVEIANKKIKQVDLLPVKLNTFFQPGLVEVVSPEPLR